MRLSSHSKYLLTILAALAPAFRSARAVDPVVSNVHGQQRADGSELVDVYYTVTDPDSPTVTVRLEVSADAGDTWNVPVTRVSPVEPVVPGKDRYILWNAGADWNNHYSNKVRFRVTASDTPPVPQSMVLIPAGSFEMGNALSASGDGNGDELPVHSVFVSAFYLDKFKVTKALWDEVAIWGAANGYDINASSASGKGVTHPAYYLTWYECIKWCNARSQEEELTPCYTLSGSVYKTGDSDDVACNWNANGYRLPTEAEREKATRGGLSGNRFPWGDTVSHSQANYYSSSDYSYDVSPTRGHHPTYNDGVHPYTSPVGSFAANGYGLFDTAGNLWEWCWDWYSSSYYASAPGTDPRGPSPGSSRVVRGGDWWAYAHYCRTANRRYVSPGTSYYLGFRSARSAVP